jgi:hypothetical protein
MGNDFGELPAAWCPRRALMWGNCGFEISLFEFVISRFNSRISKLKSQI